MQGLQQILLMASLVILAFSGCIGGPIEDPNGDPVESPEAEHPAPFDHLKRLYGDDVVLYEYEGRKIAEIHRGPMGRFEGEQWSTPNSHHSVNFSLDLDDAGDALSHLPGSGGGSFALDIDDPPVLELRLPNRDEHSDHWVRWKLSRPDIELDVVPADEVFRLPVDNPGRHNVFAELLEHPGDGEPFARFTGCFCAFLTTKWTIQGEVHPLRISQDAHYDPASMADKFDVPFPYGIPSVEASTKLTDGGPIGGADIGLGLYLRDGEPIDCVGNPEAGGPGENHAEHEIRLRWVGFKENTTVVWVGAQEEGCGDHDSWMFFNTNAVSYEVTILARGG